MRTFVIGATALVLSLATGAVALPSASAASVDVRSSGAPTRVHPAAAKSSLSRMAQTPEVNERGGAIVPVTSTESVSADFSGAGSQRVTLPARDVMPPVVAGALIQVTATALDGAVRVTVSADEEGRRTPAVGADSASVQGATSSATVLVDGGPTIWVHVDNAATVGIQVVAWVSDDERNDVGQGGVGIAAKPENVLNTRANAGDSQQEMEWLGQKNGLALYLTGRGGIPANAAQMVLVAAHLDVVGDEAGAYEALLAKTGTGDWQPLARVANVGSYDQLLAIPVDDTGLVRLRTTAPMDITMNVVGWVSRGYATQPPVEGGALTPIAQHPVSAADLRSGSTFELPGIPQQSGEVTALVSSQAFGNGTIELTGSHLGDLSSFEVGGDSTALALLPGAQDPISVSVTGNVSLNFQVLGYVRVAETTSRAKSEDVAKPRLRVTPLGASVDATRTGRVTVSGIVKDANGIVDVRVKVDDLKRRPFASINDADGSFSLDLVLSGGRHRLVVTARDFAGNKASHLLVFNVVAPEAGSPVVAPDTIVLTNALQRLVTDVKPRYIDMTSKGLPPVYPGGMIVADPFPRAAQGLLRRVRTVERVDDATWRIWTSEASLTDVLVSGDIKRAESGALQPRAGWGSWDLSLDFKKNPMKFGWDFTLPIDLHAKSILETEASWFDAALQGSLNIKGSTSFALSVRMKMEWFVVPVGAVLDYFSFQLRNKVKLSLNDSFAGVQDGHLAAVETPLGNPFSLTIPVMTGVSVTASLAPYLKTMVNGKFRLDGFVEKRMGFDFTYDAAKGGWQTPAEDLNSDTVMQAELTTSGNSRFGFKIVGSLRFNDLVGISATTDLMLLGFEGKGTLKFGTHMPEPTFCTGSDDLRIFTTINQRVSIVGVTESVPIAGMEPWTYEWYRCTPA